uniref:Reverse transcriptase domain-containing protein n=1 Tax=Tanacetum cinerariifolium TaxID=118510 RepID=A0A699HCT8_TANCI|nr:hypothetical protein [Tanacetum cinerariifolium]
MNRNYFEPNSSGFDQFQPPQYPVIHQPPQETSTEILQVRENLIEAIQVFLKKYNQIPSEEKCIALLRAEKKFLMLSELWKKSKIHQRLYKNCYSNLFMICNFLMKFNQSTQKKSLDRNDDDDDYDKESIISTNTNIFETPSSYAITTSPPVLPIEDLEVSLIMWNEEINTNLEKESNEFIKSSVKDFVLIPSKYKDTSRSDSECILPSCDDFSPIDVLEEKVVTFSNPLFEFNDEYISSDVNPLFDEVLENIKGKYSYDSNLDEPDLLVTPLSDANKDECFDSRDDDDEINVLDCEDSYYDSEGDILYLESLLNDDLVHHDPSITTMCVASILKGFPDEPPLEDNDDLFDEWKKILYDA